MKTQLSTKIFILLLGLFIVSCGPLPTPNLATETATITPSATVIPTSTVPDPFLELTAIASETKSAENRATAIAQITQMAGATSTQQYISILDSVMKTGQANLELTKINDKAQQTLIAEQTQQALNAEATAQFIVSNQQTATAVANNQSVEQVLSFANNLPNLPVSFFDTFEHNENGWSPKSSDEYSVSMKGDVLTVNVSDPSRLPFLWTCDNCNSFSNFSYQIDIKTPEGASRIVAGILFGSPTKFDTEPYQESYALSIYSSGAVLLERISRIRRDIVQVWDHRPDLITPDGKFHTLQVIAIDKYAAIYVDGKLVGDVVKLDYSSTGYIGIESQSTDVDIEYDNLKIVTLP